MWPVQQACLITSLITAAWKEVSLTAAGDLDEWETLLKLNTLAPMRLTRLVTPKMVEAKVRRYACSRLMDLCYGSIGHLMISIVWVICG